MSNQESGIRLLWLAVLLGSSTRLVLIFGLPVSQYSDMAWYLARAKELLSSGAYAEGGIPTAYWPVGYPAFLSFVLTIFGRADISGQIANLLLSVICIVLLYRWCAERFGSERIAGVAALILALYPNNMGYSVGLYSEPLFTAMLLGICVLFKPNAGWVAIILAGFIAGLATLVKAQTMLLAPLLFLLLAWRDWQLASLPVAIVRALTAIGIMAITIAPWTYRNSIVMGAPIPVSTNGGMSLLSANNPSMTTGLGYDFREDDELVRSARFSVADQVAADDRAKKLAWGWIKENPETFIALMPKKLFRLWAPDGEAEWVFQAGYPAYEEHWVWFRGVRVLNQIYYVLILIFCVWAIFRLPKVRGPYELALPFMMVFFSLLSLVFSGQSRYHAPLMPFMIGYASWVLVSWRDRRLS